MPSVHRSCFSSFDQLNQFSGSVMPLPLGLPHLPPSSTAGEITCPPAAVGVLYVMCFVRIEHTQTDAAVDADAAANVKIFILQTMSVVNY